MERCILQGKAQWLFLMRVQLGSYHKLDKCTQPVHYTEIFTQLCILYLHTHTQSYPDVIAQCVYSTFIYAFPTSWNNFDDDFKNELCNTISLWQVGEQCNMALSMIQSDLTSCLGLQAHRWCLILGRNGT